MLIQSRIVSRHELPALGCTRRLGKAETPSPSTPRCCIEEICDQRATKRTGAIFTKCHFVTSCVSPLQKNADWDDDHGEFCSGKFMVEDLLFFHASYWTEDIIGFVSSVSSIFGTVFAGEF